MRFRHPKETTEGFTDSHLHGGAPVCCSLLLHTTSPTRHLIIHAKLLTVSKQPWLCCTHMPVPTTFPILTGRLHFSKLVLQHLWVGAAVGAAQRIVRRVKLLWRLEAAADLGVLARHVLLPVRQHLRRAEKGAGQGSPGADCSSIVAGPKATPIRGCRLGPPSCPRPPLGGESNPLLPAFVTVALRYTDQINWWCARASWLLSRLAHGWSSHRASACLMVPVLILSIVLWVAIPAQVGSLKHRGQHQRRMQAAHANRRHAVASRPAAHAPTVHECHRAVLSLDQWRQL